MAKMLKPAPKPQRRRHFIKEWREYRGLTQDQLAERIGRTRGLIGQIETYRVNYATSLEAIAEALDCDIGDLLNVNPQKERQVVDIVDLLRKASPEQQAQALGYVQGLIRKN